MENKQTAVEWLVNRLNQCEPMYSFNESSEFKFYIDNLIEKAKQMEKEQIIQAWDKASYNQNRIGKEYYRDTYESNY